ncbi:MAG: T9SS type A sorting domain-containing protein [Bacteroidales bacterium]|nr:T9SS type A sorting domain-containing protein [Bacteroidales bacterium]MCF8402923.1 T9SS type A sorting domain-containing protein [Bacteroidales bacterium]
MKRLTIYLTLLISIFSIHPQKGLADTIPDSTQIFGNWNISGSPYVVMGLATIPFDSTLTIESGVRVEFKSSSNDSAFIIQYLDIGWIKANGSLIALGSETDSIVFTSLGEGRWGGIHFENVYDSIQLNYCSIGKCKSISNEQIPGEAHAGGLTFHYSQAIIENTNLSNNHIGMFAWSSDVFLNQNKITNNSDGVVYFESSGKVSSSLIRNNYNEGISSHTSATIIENNLIEGQLQGIHSYESYDTITGNLVRDNLWGGIEISRCNPLVYKNIVYGSNSGIRCTGSPRIINNTVVNNNYFGIYCGWQARPYLINNIIYGNSSLILYDSDDTVVFANNLLQLDTIPTGLTNAGGNIFNDDPMFADPGNDDFSLDAGSPCINTGIAYFEWEGAVILELEPGQYTGIAPDIGASESTYVGVNNNFSMLQRQNMVLVYPNPAHAETINFYFVGTKTEHAYIVIQNMIGAIIHQQEMQNDRNVLNIRNWTPGIYLAVVCQGGRAIAQTKVIVQ